MPNKFVVPLAVELDKTVAGGKAASLSRMIRAGLPVPAGFCVTTDAYSAYLTRLNTEPIDRSSTHDAILNGPSLSELEHSVQDEWRRQGWEEGKTSVAVRSSATAEDLDIASFAGQYESYLSLRSIQGVLHAIKKCWASAWSDHARQYAQRKNLASALKMAVIVQEMAPVELAGVAFTSEPILGDRDIIYAEAVKGYGEALVSGDIEPDLRFWFRRTGDVLRIDHLNDAELPADVLPRLISLLTQIDELFSGPQDIEWTWEGERGFSIVQARPITSVPPERSGGVPRPWDLPGRPKGGWTEEQKYLFEAWDEYNAKAILPLDWDLYDAAAWEANLRMFDNVSRTLHLEDIAVIVDGVVIGVDPAGRQCTETSSEPTRVNMKPIEDWDLTLDLWKQEAAGIVSAIRDCSSLGTEELISLIKHTSAGFRSSFCQRMASMSQWIDHSESNDPVSRWETEVRKILSSVVAPDEIETALTDLTSGIQHETSKMNKALWQLKKLAADQPQGTSSPKVRSQIGGFLERFGHFEVDNASLASEPDNLLRQLSGVDLSEQSKDPEVRFIERYKRRSAKLRQALRSQEWEALGRAVERLRYWIRVREDSKSMQNLLLPPLERLVREAGARLSRLGVLSNALEVRFLSWLDLEARLLSESPDELQERILQRRRELVEWKRNVSWLPQGFLGQEVSAEQSVFNGDGGSPGVYEGVARIIKGPDDFAQVQDGDIVVAYATNPVWTQLFNRIGGIVVERGGRTSHAAVVAREYGIPAVLGVPGIVSAVRNDEMLGIDGTLGEIRRLNGEAE